MDNLKKLQAAELRILKEYIARRGFREPSVQLEILDHFACKVEERMSANPSLSLQQAMEAAHGDFGVSGFYPIAKAYQEGLQSRYGKLFKKEGRRVLLSPQFLLALLLVVAAYLPAYYSCGQQGYLHFGINDANLLVLLAFAISWLAMVRGQRKHKDRLLTGIAAQTGGWPMFLLTLVLENSSAGLLSPWALAFNGLMVAAGVWLLLTRDRIFRMAMKEQEVLDRMNLA